MSPDNKDNSQNILVKLAASDPSAFGLLYDIYYDRIFRYCLHRLYVRQVAEDITSDIFLAASGSISRFHGSSRVQFSCWLYRLSTGKINRHFLRKRRQSQIHKRSSFEIDIAALPSGSDRRWPLLYEAILELPLTEQAIITLRYLRG